MKYFLKDFTENWDRTELERAFRRLNGKEFACQCRRHGFDSSVRKIL